MTIKTKKTRFINKIKNDLTIVFGKYTNREINSDDIDNLMKEINSFFQEYAHDKLKGGGLMPHIDRILIKNAGRMEVLKLLSHYFPEAVVEYLWKKIKQ